MAFEPIPVVKEHRTLGIGALSACKTLSLARKKAPKRIPNSIATNWKIASFVAVESVYSKQFFWYSPTVLVSMTSNN